MCATSESSSEDARFHILILVSIAGTHVRIQKVLSEGVQILTTNQARKDPNTTISGPSSARQRNAIYMAFCGRFRCWLNNECWPGSFVIFQGIRTSISKKPYIFVIFRGGGGWGGGPPPPLNPRMGTCES